MRPLEVVAIDEQREAACAVGEVREHRAREQLVPQRFPESLHLPERLRMLRTALHVANAVAAKLPLELRLSAPRGVLTALIREHLTRRAVRGDPARQRLEHELRLLVMRHRVRDHEARVVVHERHHVQPLVTTKQEREQVRLPHLIRSRALEPTRKMIAGAARLRRLDQPRLVQDPAHLTFAHADALEASEHIADAARSPRGILALRVRHRLGASRVPAR